MKQELLYEKIYRDIEAAIVSGRYQAGDRLPSEKQLSIQYHVSRITSKKAMELLAEEGKIIRMAGKGSFVGDMAGGPKAEMLSQGQKGPPQSGGSGDILLIGVILEDFGVGFGTELLNKIEQECQKQGCDMVLRCTKGSVEAESKAIDDFRRLGAAGILMMCVQDETYNAKVLQMVVEGYPVVTIDRQLKGLPVPHIGTDNAAAARELTTYLLEEGCRKICFVKPAAEATSTLLDRQNGFIAAMNEHGIVADKSEWITDLKGTLPSTYSEERQSFFLHSEKSTEKNTERSMVQQDMERVEQYLEEHPDTDAFFAAEYSIARMIGSCLRKRKSKQTCKVVCFDGMDDILPECDFTHIRQDEASIGRLAVRTLIDVIRGDRGQKIVLVPYELRKGLEDER